MAPLLTSLATILENYTRWNHRWPFCPVDGATIDHFAHYMVSSLTILAIPCHTTPSTAQDNPPWSPYLETIKLAWNDPKSSQVKSTWLDLKFKSGISDLTWLENWKGGQRLDFDLNLRWHGVYHSESTREWGHGVQGGDRMYIYGTNPSPSSDNFSFGYWLDLTWTLE